MRTIIEHDSAEQKSSEAPMRADGYIRGSTDKQADRGVSLEAQIERVRAMATVHSASPIEIIRDVGESAKSLDRPGMQRVLEMVRARCIDMVIVAKLDRPTRSVTDLLELFRPGRQSGGRFRLASIKSFAAPNGRADPKYVIKLELGVEYHRHN